MAVGFLIAGGIHLLPVAGVLGAARLEALYGTAIEDRDLLVLMRHRAVLFGCLGALLCLAAFRAELRPVALTLGLASATAFLALALGGHGAALRRVVVADVVALAALLAAGVGMAWGGAHR